MEVFHDLRTWQSRRKLVSQSIGFVPTMGALHAGHESLLQRARAENDFVVLSIFVNPTQFNDPKDLEKYPSTLKEDFALAERVGVDFILNPERDEFYPDDYAYRISENRLAKTLDGIARPGHFDGVLTIVMKLLNVVHPDRAYFGEKDYQQLKLVEGMVQAFFIPCQIVPCPTVRESDGLAMSSRNRNLPPEARELAPKFAKLLMQTKSQPSVIQQELQKLGFEVDYIVDIDQRRFGAVRIGGVRLIDNVSI